MISTVKDKVNGNIATITTITTIYDNAVDDVHDNVDDDVDDNVDDDDIMTLLSSWDWDRWLEKRTLFKLEWGSLTRESEVAEASVREVLTIRFYKKQGLFEYLVGIVDYRKWGCWGVSSEGRFF